jgi:hypothetical protein
MDLLNLNSDLLGKDKEYAALERPRSRWEYNTKMDLQTVGFGGMDCIDLSQDRKICWTLVNAVMNIRVP